MRKLRLIIYIATGGLFALTIVGIILLIVNQNLNLLDTSYEIIAFSVGMSGMIMAVLSEIDSHQSEKRFGKMMNRIEELNREHDADEKVDAKFQKKLDALLQFDQKIYQKLSRKNKKSRQK